MNPSWQKKQKKNAEGVRSRLKGVSESKIEHDDCD
jgi:hypothetical protein